MKTLPLLLSTLLLAAALPAAAQQMNYQGRLTDASGNPLADGQQTLEFRLFDAATGGTEVWGPFVLDGTAGNGKGPRADLVNGRFNAVLGPLDTAGRPLANAFTNTTRYLQIKVGGNTPILPRQAILDTPTALMAQRIPNVFTAGSNVGITTVAPAGRLNILEAAGTAHNPNSGTLVLDHDNNGGASSIVFRSKVNRGSDYGFIQYQDAATVGGAGESARLVIGTSNDGDDHLILSPAGNVGIGAITPTTKLTVLASGYGIEHTDGTRRLGTYVTAAGGWLGTISNSPLNFFVNNGGPSASIDTNGRFSANSGLTVSGGADIAGIAYFTGDVNMRASGGRPLVVRGNDGTDVVAVWGTPNSPRFDVFGNAAKTLGGTSWLVLSDARLKQDVKPFARGLDEIRRLRTVTFHYKEDPQRGISSKHENFGFIAQEVQKVMPEAVTQGQDGYLGLSVDPIHWAGINAIKELDSAMTAEKAATAARIKSLAEENTALQDRMNARETRVGELEKNIAALEKENATLKAQVEAQAKALAAQGARDKAQDEKLTALAALLGKHSSAVAGVSTAPDKR